MSGAAGSGASRPGAAGSYTRAERLALGPFHRALAPVLRPVLAALIWLRIPPGALSLAQLPLGFAAAALVLPAPRVALALFLVSVYLLDGLDGPLARATGRASRFGALLDQVADHVREITIVGGLVAAGALRGEIGVAYALTYPLFNFLLYAANRHGAPLPLAIKNWMVFYPLLVAYLGFGLNWLDYAVSVSAGVMVLAGAVALFRLRKRLQTADGDSARRNEPV